MPPRKRKTSSRKKKGEKSNNPEESEVISSPLEKDRLTPPSTESGGNMAGMKDIGDLPGIGPATAKKLQDSGFGTLESLATVSIGELVAGT